MSVAMIVTAVKNLTIGPALLIAGGIAALILFAGLNALFWWLALAVVVVAVINGLSYGATF